MTVARAAAWVNKWCICLCGCRSMYDRFHGCIIALILDLSQTYQVLQPQEVKITCRGSRDVTSISADVLNAKLFLYRSWHWDPELDHPHIDSNQKYFQISNMKDLAGTVLRWGGDTMTPAPPPSLSFNPPRFLGWGPWTSDVCNPCPLLTPSTVNANTHLSILSFRDTPLQTSHMHITPPTMDSGDRTEVDIAWKQLDHVCNGALSHHFQYVPHSVSPRDAAE